MIPCRTGSILLRNGCACIHPIVNVGNTRSYSPLDQKERGGSTRAGRRRNSNSDRNASCSSNADKWMDEKEIPLPPPSDFSVHQMFQEHRPLAIGPLSATRWMYDVERQLREDNARLANVNASANALSNPLPIQSSSPIDACVSHEIPFLGFQALTGNQYFKPSTSNLSTRLLDKIPSTSNVSITSAYTSTSATPSFETVSVDQLVDILLSGSSSSGWDAVTTQLVHEQVMLAYIQAEVNVMAREALAKIEAKHFDKHSRRAKTMVSLLVGNRSPRMHAISLIKRKRKKMNKHKYEKRKDANRGTMRSNKESLRKKGQDRQKQV